MSAKAVREYHGKKLLARHVRELSGGEHVLEERSVLITPMTDLESLATDPETSWLQHTSLVVKPDQLIKRRGKAGLVGIQLEWSGVQAWIQARMGTTVAVEHVTGVLDHFIVEPFVPHAPEDEYYVCLQSDREGDEILFCADGGVDVGDVDAKAARLHVPIDVDEEGFTPEHILSANLLDGVPDHRQPRLASFLHVLMAVYRKLNFTYMEINPIVFAADGANHGGQAVEQLLAGEHLDRLVAKERAIVAVIAGRLAGSHRSASVWPA